MNWCIIVPIIIVTIVVLLLICKKQLEHFTTDEAVRNVASLYNTANMSITNLGVTDTLTSNKLNVTGATTTKGITNTGAMQNTGNITNTGTLTNTGGANVSGVVNAGRLYAGGGSGGGSGGTHFPWEGDGVNYIRGTTQVDGNLTVSQNFNVGGNLAVGGTLMATKLSIGQWDLGEWGGNNVYFGITHRPSGKAFVMDSTNGNYLVR